MANLFTVNNIDFGFEVKHLFFKSYSFKIPDQKINVLMGPSGCGKSTLLRLLNRLLEPASGSIFYQETSIQQIPVLELRCKIALVPQLRSLPDETVKDFVLYAVSLHKKKVDHEHLIGLLKNVLLDESILTRSVRELSSGELQRINLVRVLLNNPEVLLLDEPTANLDLNTTLKLEEVMKDLVQKLNLRVVWVTHDQDQAKRLEAVTLEVRR